MESQIFLQPDELSALRDLSGKFDRLQKAIALLELEKSSLINEAHEAHNSLQAVQKRIAEKYGNGVTVQMTDGAVIPKK